MLQQMWDVNWPREINNKRQSSCLKIEVTYPCVQNVIDTAEISDNVDAET